MTRGLASLRRLTRALGAADFVFFAYAAAYTAWVFTHVPGRPLNDAIGDLAFLPLGLAIGSRFAANARLSAATGGDTRTQAGWWLLTAGALLLWVSGSAWTYFVRFTGPRDAPAWIDMLEYLQLGCVIAASLCFPARPHRPEDRLRRSLDVSLIFVAAGIMAVRYGSEVVAGWRQVLGVDLVALRAFLDWAVFFLLAVGTFNKRDACIRRAMGFLLLANICVLAGNSALSSIANYRAGDPVDLLWFAAWVFKWVSARSAARAYRQAPPASAAEADDAAASTVVPHLIVGAVFASLIYRAAIGQTERLTLDMYGAMVMTALLVLRQTVELRANRRLFESQMAAEARFRSLVQNASDLVFVIDDRGRIVYLSPSAERLLGPAGGETVWDLVAPDDADVLSALLKQASFATEQVQLRMRTGDGGWREIDTVGSDLRNDPAVRGIVLNGRDVTERNDLERRLQHAQRLDAVSHLAGGLAHDFNNMLAAIRGYTELLQADVQPRSAAAVDLAAIEQAVDRAAGVTRKLLAFSRRQAVQPVTLDLAGVAHGLEPILRQLLGTAVTLRISGQPGLWPVRADQSQIEQVIINLATNARDAMPEGGTLALTLANRPTAARLVSDADMVALTASDTGTGMSPAVRERIFEPFFSTKARDKGMGLGLAMVHGIVTQSGGRIDVESVPGHGTTFTVLLPRDAGAPVAVAPPKVSAAAMGIRRILVVDDEPGVRTVVRRMLTRAGFDVVEAESGPAALAKIGGASAPFDVLLTDLVMPGMHGRELIERVGRLAPGMAVVCMTGYAGDGDSADGLGFAGHAVITKPFSADALLRVLAAAAPGPPAS